MLSLQLAKKPTPSPFRPLLRPLWPLSMDIFSSLEQDMIHTLEDIIASMKLMGRFHQQLLQETTEAKSLPVLASSMTKSIEIKTETPTSTNSKSIKIKTETPPTSTNSKSIEIKTETPPTSTNSKSIKTETPPTSTNSKSIEIKTETPPTSTNSKSNEIKTETPLTSTKNKAENAVTISDIKSSEGGFVVSLGVQGFSPQELTVKLVEKKLLVSGAKECKSDDGKGSFFYKCQIFRKEVDLPQDVRPEDLKCTVTNESQLQIEVFRTPSQERTVPIQHAALHAKTLVSSSGKDSRS
ncbi:glycoprotein gp100-like [Hyla sarda]|uniref:glycoprotein gp100-like n=1 Tax=Hyla sarda TaxID=327740 RepID=UPI0024C35CDA|nr:glycoprotein gp100-like [Hyla sarda]